MADREHHDRAGAAPDNPRSLLEAIIRSSNDAIIGKDLNGTVTSWNPAAERLFGFAATEIIGQSIMILIPPERAGEERAIMDWVGRGEKLTHFETERLTRDGRVIPVSLSLSPIHDDNGAIVGVSKIVRDLSEAQRLNREIQLRRALVESILDTVPDGLVIIDKRGIVQSFSQAAERMFGYLAAEVLGRNVSVLMPEPYAAQHDAYVEHYLSTGERRIIGIGRVVVGRRKDGTTFPMELQVGEVRVPGSHLFTGFVRDLTERQSRERRLAELQSELIHVSRLSELGQMVSALAHEVNQPLTALANYLSGIRRMLTPDSPSAPTASAPNWSALGQAVDKAIQQAERAHGIVQGLRGLVRKDARAKQTESLEKLIQETSALALTGTGRSINLDMRVAADATHGFIDKVQIQQVVLNLMRNAVEAMASSPVRTLTVATARRGDRIEIEVSDTGPGLPGIVLARLFQPFVTTKPDGLGIGLSISRTIVEAHGGELAAQNRPSGGVVFRFTVPGSADQETDGGDGRAN